MFRKPFRIAIRFLIGFVIWTMCVHMHRKRHPNHEQDLHTARIRLSTRNTIQNALYFVFQKPVPKAWFERALRSTKGKIRLSNQERVRITFRNGFQNVIRSFVSRPSVKQKQKQLFLEKSSFIFMLLQKLCLHDNLCCTHHQSQDQLPPVLDFRPLLTNTSVTFTLRQPYGGRRTPKSSDSCGCRRNSAVATGPPYGESLCFTGRRGGRRIIAWSYNFFHFYVSRRNLTRRSHAVDRTVAVRSPNGPLAGALRMP